MKITHKAAVVGLTFVMAGSGADIALARTRHHHYHLYSHGYRTPGPIVTGSSAGVAMGVLGTGIVGAPGSIPNFGLGLGYFGPGYGYYGPGYGYAGY